MGGRAWETHHQSFYKFRLPSSRQPSSRRRTFQRKPTFSSHSSRINTPRHLYPCPHPPILLEHCHGERINSHRADTRPITSWVGATRRQSGQNVLRGSQHPLYKLEPP